MNARPTHRIPIHPRRCANQLQRVKPGNRQARAAHRVPDPRRLPGCSRREPQRRTFADVRAGEKRVRTVPTHRDLDCATASAAVAPCTMCMTAMRACLRHLREAMRKDKNHRPKSRVVNTLHAWAWMLTWRVLHRRVVSVQCHGTTPRACHSAQYIGMSCTGCSLLICCWNCGTTI